jgi:hypothetical protein
MSALGRLLQPTYVVLASNSVSALNQIVTYSNTPAFFCYVVSSERRGEERRGLTSHTHIFAA